MRLRNSQMEETQRARFMGRDAELLNPPWTSTCSPTWKLFRPHTLEIFMEASSQRLDGSLLTPFPACLPSQEGALRGAGAEYSQLPITAVTQGIPRVLGALCQEPRAETNIYALFSLTSQGNSPTRGIKASSRVVVITWLCNKNPLPVDWAGGSLFLRILEDCDFSLW